MKRQHIIYSAEDIKRYLAGDMSNEEMHDIEKAALDDPLLADAIEGYAGAADEDWSNVLVELKTKIESKENTPVIDIKSSPGFKWWKAAAAVLLIGVTGTITYVMNSSKSNEAIVKTEKTPVLDSSVAAIVKADRVDEKTVAVNDVPKKETDLINITENANRSSDLVNEQNSVSSKQRDLVYQPHFKPAEAEKAHDGLYYNRKADADDNDGAAQNAASAPSSTSNTVNAEVGNNILEQNKATSAEPPILAYDKQENASKNFIKQQYQLSGSVINQNGEPVSFASLKLTTPKKQFLTTDAKGNFSFAATDSVLNVEIASAGYTPGRFKLNANINNGIVLQPSNTSLNEVTISSNVPKDKLAKKRVNTVNDELEETAEPTGGWDSYNEYLDNNVHVPGNNQNVQGTVEAIVKVNRKGEVDDVKITHSLNAECDKEAVRVIKSGPGWKIKSGKKGYSKVKVRFQQQD